MSALIERLLNKQFDCLGMSVFTNQIGPGSSPKQQLLPSLINLRLFNSTHYVNLKHWLPTKTCDHSYLHQNFIWVLPGSAVSPISKVLVLKLGEVNLFKVENQELQSQNLIQSFDAAMGDPLALLYTIPPTAGCSQVTCVPSLLPPSEPPTCLCFPFQTTCPHLGT